jgi:tetratricopeptide (TPR) repeat protein
MVDNIDSIKLRLLRESQKAEKIREEGENKASALEKSALIWEKIYREAVAIKDWERAVDALGQLGINLKILQYPTLALIPIRRCIEIVEKYLSQDERLQQIYLGELFDLSGMIGDSVLLKEAVVKIPQTIELARKAAPKDLCHRLVQAGKIYHLLGKNNEAGKLLEEAYQIATNEAVDVAHPAHRAGAIIASAVFARDNKDLDQAIALLGEARQMAVKYSLKRRLEQIEDLGKEWKTVA